MPSARIDWADKHNHIQVQGFTLSSEEKAQGHHKPCWARKTDVIMVSKCIVWFGGEEEGRRKEMERMVHFLWTEAYMKR